MWRRDLGQAAWHRGQVKASKAVGWQQQVEGTRAEEGTPEGSTCKTQRGARRVCVCVRLPVCTHVHVYV